MILNYIKSQSSVYPELVDTTSSKTTVYLRKNVTEVETEYGAMYEYDEAKLTKVEYEEYLKGIANFDSVKANKVTESKSKLAEWLESNPMPYIDGKQYTVTKEKQDLLNSNLSSYERAVEVNAQYPLKWNATGEECVSWEYRALIALSLAIADYVSPKVAKQQSIERKIMACETIEELNEVRITYD